jgi:hypothetical protein
MGVEQDGRRSLGPCLGRHDGRRAVPGGQQLDLEALRPEQLGGGVGGAPDVVGVLRQGADGRDPHQRLQVGPD